MPGKDVGSVANPLVTRRAGNFDRTSTTFADFDATALDPGKAVRPPDLCSRSLKGLRSSATTAVIARRACRSLCRTRTYRAPSPLKQKTRSAYSFRKL